MLLLSIVFAIPAEAGKPLTGFLQKWEAKTVVTDEEVKRAGLENCFTAEPLSDATFQRMQGKSWKRTVRWTGMSCATGGCSTGMRRDVHSWGRWW